MKKIPNFGNGWIENFQLDNENREFLIAIDTFKNSNKSFFLTGRAGAGKTTFLKYAKSISNKRTIVVAPTGVAAINAGGVTINSFFKLPFDPLRPDDHRFRTKKTSEDHLTIYEWLRYNKSKVDLIQNMDVLIIDEISMVRADVLDAIEKILGVYRRKPYYPFGGVQVIMIGDPFQLPPVIKDSEWSILSDFYESPYFFSSSVFKFTKPLKIELKKIYRQANDQRFISILNEIRYNQITEESLKALDERYIRDFKVPENQAYIHLCATNKASDWINESQLNQINEESHSYTGEIKGNFPDSYMRTLLELELKEGAQIMVVVNDSGEPIYQDGVLTMVNREYYNGSIGIIRECHKDQIVVDLGNREVTIRNYQWENVKYVWNDDSKTIDKEVLGTFSQIPVKLAWAITIHKSQGLTFDNVIADVNGSFTHGQVYTALSRCTSMDGLVLKAPMNKFAIKVDSQVSQFANSFLEAEELNDELVNAKADYLYAKARDSFRDRKFDDCNEFLKKAIGIRNDKETPEFRRVVLLLIKTYDHWKHTEREFSTDQIIQLNSLLEFLRRI